MDKNKISLVYIISSIIIVLIIGCIIFLSINYVKNGGETTYEIKLERCMQIYHDYNYCKYRSY